ncbi:hypothetical protein D9758_006574 [Tetrapyrgos nigripes]|uniref:Major facilitator superfamily (MFS) profile domain-containing protein n=1 Tax=Tetrapyrgos nigripes TaxID=182062 RepID=A0A8H5LRH4_9AGAR|nr:hypothetical protein D9758_006574 [Tetrapyrgos nigripes]
MTAPAERSQFTPQESTHTVVGPAVSSTVLEGRSKELPIYIDIEHMPVADDPRKWSNLRKNFVLLQVAMGAMVAGFAGNIQMPAVGEMQQALHTTSSQISLSLSLFILFQGCVPLIWSSISEVKGRKMVYLISMAISTVGAIVAATANSIGLVIGFRVVQAAGSSAVMSIGAATLADIYDPVERGAKQQQMGVYYIAPLLGPSLGAIFGGILTTAFSWRGPFYFLTILCGLVFLSFLFFKDTYRQERSSTYQIVLKRRLKELQRQRAKSASSSATPTVLDEKMHHDDGKQLEPVEKAEKDLEKGEENGSGTVTPNITKETENIIPAVNVSLTDVNPVQPILTVLRRPYNVVMLFASGEYEILSPASFADS